MNMADMATKGRSTLAGAKLTENEVIKIRHLYATGRFTQDGLAAAFDVTQRQISRIVRGKRWKHLPKPKGTAVNKYKGHWTRLTRDEVHKIRTLYATGEFTQMELAVAFDTAQSNIGSIVRGETWKHLLKPKEVHNEQT